MGHQVFKNNKSHCCRVRSTPNVWQDFLNIFDPKSFYWHCVSITISLLLLLHYFCITQMATIRFRWTTMPDIKTVSAPSDQHLQAIANYKCKSSTMQLGAEKKTRMRLDFGMQNTGRKHQNHQIHQWIIKLK